MEFGTRGHRPVVVWGVRKSKNTTRGTDNSLYYLIFTYTLWWLKWGQYYNIYIFFSFLVNVGKVGPLVVFDRVK